MFTMQFLQKAHVMVRQVVVRLCRDRPHQSGHLVFGQAARLVFLATTTRTGLIGFDLLSMLLERTTPLYQTLLQDPKFHEQILDFDRDCAEACRAAGCRTCSGALHAANYWRRPRGRSIALGEEHNLRFSFCCAVDGCRDRATPPSLRFLGRKVYLATIVILISAMCNGLTERRLGKLAEAIGVDRRTVARWRTWWLTTFTRMPFWQANSAEFMPPVERDRLPASLLNRFRGDTKEQLLKCLPFLGPITGGVSMQVI